jgi:2-hydroxy-3-keto-5-methylthiopentenyl-1-phosphate phosphatase
VGIDLVTYCEKEGIPFTTFGNFDDILAVMKDIVEGRITVQEAAKGRK